ncbi:MAG: hypothetical protein M1816_008108 [Peltula sp. TS41687]|nr:MAG: hypothetical protein M1816_008108 [Peltula sp. TS41687]
MSTHYLIDRYLQFDWCFPEDVRFINMTLERLWCLALRVGSPSANKTNMIPASPHRPPLGGVCANADGRMISHKMSLPYVPASRPSSVVSKSNSTDTPARESQRSSNGSSATVSSVVSSRRSQTTGEYRMPNGEGKQSRLKSQYPKDATENHVEYILVASFHVDRGPIMEHQFPGAISEDEHMLAELMLPDQAHVRNQDWTIFFLHKDTTTEDNVDRESDKKQRRRRKDPVSKGDGEGNENEADDDEDDEDDDDEEEDELAEGDSEYESDEDDEDEMERLEGPPLVYVLNLVNTKQDVSAKRKILSLTIRQPLLLLALEEYFKSPYPETLACLYQAVNSMDLSLMPRLSVLERHILQASDTKELFMEKFQQMIQQRMAEEHEQAGTSNNPQSAGQHVEDARRMNNGIQSGHPHRYTLPRDTHEFETRVIYNGIPIPVKVPTALSPETVGGFSLIKLIQTFSTPHTKDPQPFMLHPHLTSGGAYTHPIIVLANAMLTQKRVTFLGHNLPSGEVAEAVLAACALAAGGTLRGFTRFAFPYTDLTKIDDLLKVPGFVAGVTNPAFANHPGWWDLLCDLPSGRMKISHRIEPAPVTEGLVNFQQQNPSYASPSSASFTANGADPTGDQAFMEDVLRSIASRHGEAVIRAKWRDWVLKFTRVAAAFEESVYGVSALHVGGEEADTQNTGITGHGYVWSDEASRQRELAGSVYRIEGWRNTRSYYNFIQDLAQLYSLRPIKSLDLHHLHDRLRTQKLPPSESAAIYLAFSSRVHSYAEICQLLTVTPESHAGLFYLSLGLFHPRPDVRAGIWGLLSRIRQHLAGRHFWNSLHPFAKVAFFRQHNDVEGTTTATRSTTREEHDDGRGRREGDTRLRSEENNRPTGRAS